MDNLRPETESNRSMDQKTDPLQDGQDTVTLPDEQVAEAIALVKTTLDQQPSEVSHDLTTSPEPSEDNILGAEIAKADDGSVEKLTYGVLAHFLPSMQKAKSSLQGLTENQRILIETVQQENAKFAECQALKEVTETMERAREYQSKLVGIRREMLMLHDQAAKLKKRAVKLQQQKQKEALQQEQERDRQLERERQLEAKPSRALPK